MALPLWNSKTAHTTRPCLHPNDGVSWGFVGVDILQTSTLPFSPTDHHANDMGVAALSQKYNNLLPITLIRSHSTIANGDIRHSFHTGHSWWSHLHLRQRGQRSLIAIIWTSHVHNCTRTWVLACFISVHSLQARSSRQDIGP